MQKALEKYHCIFNVSAMDNFCLLKFKILRVFAQRSVFFTMHILCDMLGWHVSTITVTSSTSSFHAVLQHLSSSIMSFYSSLRVSLYLFVSLSSLGKMYWYYPTKIWFQFILRRKNPIVKPPIGLGISEEYRTLEKERTWPQTFYMRLLLIRDLIELHATIDDNCITTWFLCAIQQRIFIYLIHPLRAPRWSEARLRQREAEDGEASWWGYGYKGGMRDTNKKWKAVTSTAWKG